MLVKTRYLSQASTNISFLSDQILIVEVIFKLVLYDRLIHVHTRLAQLRGIVIGFFKREGFELPTSLKGWECTTIHTNQTGLISTTWDILDFHWPLQWLHDKLIINLFFFLKIITPVLIYEWLNLPKYTHNELFFFSKPTTTNMKLFTR